MSRKAHGQLRRGQVITTYGPGALIDLPRHSAIIGGLETWPKTEHLEEVVETRLSRKLGLMTGIHNPRLYAPPPESNDPREPMRGIGAWRFPEWFVVQDEQESDDHQRSRRLVHRSALDEKGRFDNRFVVATRFVCACPRGHVDDVDWYRFVHGSEDNCKRQLWLDERGTSGDLGDPVVRCECGKQRSLYEATQLEEKPLGTCRGARPWLGRNTRVECNQPSRLLIRTASNSYFPQVVSVLSLPDRGSAVETAVAELWDDLQIVDDAAEPWHRIGMITPDGLKLIEVHEPEDNLPVGTLQKFLDAYLEERGAGDIDYVHGTKVLFEKGLQKGNAGFYVPGMDKSDLFKTVILDGALPRKTFSMGEAKEKRFYMESRRIQA